MPSRVHEPFSKGIAAVMTVTLIGYVGLDTFKSLIVGFKQLVEAVDRANTFDELRTEGERYGKVMGRTAARAFAMLAVAAVGNTTAGLAAKVPTLPGATQAGSGPSRSTTPRTSSPWTRPCTPTSARSIHRSATPSRSPIH
ncbi:MULTISPECIES: hypothetical protein [Corallococcus]|uniref:hypothetical protein n=1 Tax=Corallococcus sp. CA031C TaxID=2316725 RepID=UPI001F20C798|nr:MULTISPECIES: hypothetical protein [Corallococcus]